MSSGLVIVLAVAAGVPLLLGFLPWLRLPGALLEIAAGVVLGPSLLGWVEPDETIRVLALLGLSILLFLAGYEVDPRRFRGHTGKTVGFSLAMSVVAAVLVAVVLSAAGVDGGIVIGIGLLATSLGLIVPVLADSGALDKPVGRLTVAGASAGEIAAVVVLSVGLAGSDTPLAGKLLLLGLLLLGLGVIAAVVVGAEHSMRITAIIRRSADTSAQIRIRLTVLLVAGLALAAEGLGFEAILGAFLAGVLVRSLDPEPEKTHPLYPVKLEAVGFGLLVPIFFITSGLNLDLSGLVDSPSALLLVPVFLAALCIVRGLPALAFRGDLATRDVIVVGLLQATSLPFLLTVSQIGTEMDLIDPATAAGLITAGLVSVLVFPAVALRLISKEESHANSKAALSQ
ncbi:cation:proton antiporter [Antrihabitans stalactiti]|uniref:Cation:proton antiporter n=1 Tax=Antrihabitans stalactiti TaxID=2584121 RepID=A0A848K621_9NOCA|nr:cation:proton antiporter [Antrihabitans stalactiti]NMN94011.1 cation:proton antiporter [Antrihabitans stalactiti]